MSAISSKTPGLGSTAESIGRTVSYSKLDANFYFEDTATGKGHESGDEVIFAQRRKDDEEPYLHRLEGGILELYLDSFVP